MKYAIVGADRESGEDVELTVEATNEPEARAKASRRGILVAGCQLREEATAKSPLPHNPKSRSSTAAPPHTINGEMAAAPKSSVGGDILFVLGYLVAIACLIMWCYLSIQIHLSGDGIAQLVWLVVTATSVWVAYDAESNRIPVIAKRPYQPVSNGWMRWLISCLILWIAAFPIYLVRRSRYVGKTKPDETRPAATTEFDVEKELRKYKKLLDDGLIDEVEWNRRRTRILENA